MHLVRCKRQPHSSHAPHCVPPPHTGTYAVLHAALQCLHAWLRLSPDGISPARASAGQLAARHPGLVAAVAALLAPCEAQLAAGADRPQLLAAEVLAELLGPGTFGDDAAAERAALEAALASLLALRGAALAPGAAGAAAARAIATVVSAAAERDAELISGCAPAAGSSGSGSGANGANAAAGGGGGGGEALALAVAQLMLDCARRPEREACQAAAEYFLMVNTVPLAARHPQMGAPLFSALAAPLLAHCRLPEAFESWQDCVEEDEEAFAR